MYSSEDLDIFSKSRTMNACFRTIERRKCMKYLTTQYIGTYTSAYTKGYALN